MFIIDFEVEQFGPALFGFPVDMLRYDHCWPCSEEDSAKIIQTNDLRKYQNEEEVTVKLRAYGPAGWEPTRGRWESFGWVVVSRTQGRKM